jgi:hypothetical protein
MTSNVVEVIGIYINDQISGDPVHNQPVDIVERRITDYVAIPVLVRSPTVIVVYSDWS